MAEQVIATMLTALAKSNDATSTPKGSPSFYDAMEVPAISLLDMLKRWLRYSSGPNEVVILAAILIDRAVGKGLLVTSYSVHRVLVAALVVATKYQSDQVFSNKHYAKVCGVSSKEIFRLEASFLNDLEWETFITPEEFRAVCKSLSKKVKKN